MTVAEISAQETTLSTLREQGRLLYADEVAEGDLVDLAGDIIADPNNDPKFLDHYGEVQAIRTIATSVELVTQLGTWTFPYRHAFAVLREED